MKLLTMDLQYEHDVVMARQRARQIAAALKFDLQEQTRIATAVSEIARNAFQYAGRGKVEFCIDENGAKMFVISVQDAGPGISNLREILDGKYISQTGMGLGLIGAKRLMDQFEIQTAPGSTMVRLSKNLPLRFSGLSQDELNSLLMKVESRSPDNVYEELQQQNKELLRTLDELRARQSELVQLNTELDETNRGVVALYAELNDKADFLQRASELKSRFLSNMSHEFRTPLNSILALSGILLDRLDGQLSPEQEKQVRYIRGSAADLTDMVNDLLDLAKVEAGKVTVRPIYFEVASLFGALRGMLRPLLMQNSSVSLVFDDPQDIPEIYSDDAKVSQILRNFISNALKFTERGEIRVSVTLGHDRTVVFSVADTGIGIAEEDQAHIFEEWGQVEGRLQREAKGSGLGLPLSRGLAQILGGDVYVKSRPGLGSTFYLSIPITFAGERPIALRSEQKREFDSSKLPVLIVEDHPESLFLYEEYFKRTEFQVIPAKNVKEAREVLRQHQPVAIVLDVLLQGEHSWDFLKELKEQPTSKDIPVLVVTVVDNRNKALSLGAEAFHTKPVPPEWLLEQLQTRAAQRIQKRVLIVDNDDVARYVLKGLLANADYQILEASGGTQGLEMARNHTPNAILLDLDMPDMNGFDVLSKLKEDGETSNIPVIICSSRVLSDDDRSRLGTAVDVVPKENPSREIALAHLTEAFAKAGLNSGSRLLDLHAIHRSNTAGDFRGPIGRI